LYCSLDVESLSMALGSRSEVVDKKYLFEYEVGEWSLGKTQVLQDRSSEHLKSCHVVRKGVVRNSEEAVARLKRLQGLKHPHINSVSDVLEDNKSVFIISDKTAGNDMAEWLERTLEEGNWVQEQTCAAYIREALTAIAHAHQSRVHHGQLKPGSLLLTSKLPDAQVKVSDFGLAPILDSGCGNLRKFSTPFTAPEIKEGGVISAAADVYSLGAIAHMLLVGQPPPEDQGGWGPLLWNREDKAAWSDRSPASRDFVLHLLRADPSERPTAARALKHPWLRGAASRGTHPQAKSAEEATPHRMLCFMISVLLMPEMMEFKTLHQLRMAFTEVDEDQDGLVSCERVQELLKERGIPHEVATAVVEIADVERSNVMDMCATAVAMQLAKECGDTARKAADLSPRLLKRFFTAYGDPKNLVVSLSQLRSKLCTATAREVEVRCGVDLEEVLTPFQENPVINSQTLVSELSSSDGRGTPLAEHEVESAYGEVEGPLGIDFIDEFLGPIFQTCGRCGSNGTRSVQGKDKPQVQGGFGRLLQAMRV